MTKKNFLTLLFGVITGMLFAIGMCMTLLCTLSQLVEDGAPCGSGHTNNQW